LSLLPIPAHYVPYHELAGRPHIVVDGKHQQGTSLTLSHWPWNNTPARLRRDTSTHSVYAYLADPVSHQQVSAVSNSHYDEDGLLSMFALVNPELAMKHRELCIATSYATDFWRCVDESAAKLAFVLGAWSAKETSPLGAAVFELPLRERIIAQYQGMLEALPQILANPFHDEAQWLEEYEFWMRSRERVAAGEVVIDSYPELDLTVVNVPADLPLIPIRRYLGVWELPVHPFAIFAHTNSSRILWSQADRVSFQYRYESWVQISSFRPQPRVDLGSLAEQLTELEPGATQWCFEGVHEVAARLFTDPAASTGLAPQRILTELSDFLRRAPPAWDPYGEPPEYP
jgi:hypothetical protein